MRVWTSLRFVDALQWFLAKSYADRWLSQQVVEPRWAANASVEDAESHGRRGS
jgi:hypothetical protein